MNKCPRCDSPIDESTRSACPICFSPLNAQPGSQAQPSATPSPQRMASPGAGGAPAAQQNAAPMRVSLTGEEYSPIDAAAPAAASPGYTAGPQPLSAPKPVRPTMPYRATTAPSALRVSGRDNSERNSLFNKVAVYLGLVLGLVGGGWWFWMHRTNPKGQVEHYLHATQWLDWGVVWDLSSPPPGNKTRHEFVSTMNNNLDDNPLYKIAARRKNEKITFDVGEPSYSGEEAVVKVSVTGSPFKRNAPIPFRLHNFAGVWKVEPPDANPLVLIGAEATKAEKEQQARDLEEAVNHLPPPGSP